MDTWAWAGQNERGVLGAFIFAFAGLSFLAFAFLSLLIASPSVGLVLAPVVCVLFYALAMKLVGGEL